MRNQFHDLIKMEAWKHMENWIEDECQRSIDRLDIVDAKDLNINLVCEQRGYRNGLRKVVRELKGLAEGR